MEIIKRETNANTHRLKSHIQDGYIFAANKVIDAVNASRYVRC